MALYYFQPIYRLAEMVSICRSTEIWLCAYLAACGNCSITARPKYGALLFSAYLPACGNGFHLPLDRNMALRIFSGWRNLFQFTARPKYVALLCYAYLAAGGNIPIHRLAKVWLLRIFIGLQE
jgi:hypothetical protein